MSGREEELRVRPGRVCDRALSSGRPQSFVHQVIAAARRAGLTVPGLGASSSKASRFGRGQAAARYALRSPSRRVVVKARVVRHRGRLFRSAPLAKHVSYLQRDGVTRDGADARPFDAHSDDANGGAFAERCAEDRHHFRFIVSPEDATEMEDLRAFTRDLMARAEADLGTRLDWVPSITGIPISPMSMCSCADATRTAAIS